MAELGDRESIKAKIKKWARGINTKNTTLEDLEDYIKTKVYKYQLDKRSNFNLWDLFKDDFKNFDINVFVKVTRKDIQNLRSCLCCGGVFMASNGK